MAGHPSWQFTSLSCLPFGWTCRLGKSPGCKSPACQFESHFDNFAIVILNSADHFYQDRWTTNNRRFRSSCPEVFFKKSVLRNFAKFTRKHLCQRLFFNKVACNYIKKEALVQVFSCEFCELSKSTFFYRTPLWWLLLKILLYSNGMAQWNGTIRQSYI